MEDHASLIPPPIWAERGSPEYRRISIALFLAGFSTFSLLYCVQPLMPLFAQDFGISAAASSLPLSLATAILAFAIIAAATLSERFGRRNLMVASLFTSAGLTVLTAFLPGWSALIGVRALVGFTLGGVPAVSIAYLAEELDPRGIGYSMGLYVAGNAFGGMMGRVATSGLLDFFSWRTALGIVGAFDLMVAVLFLALLPESRNFTSIAKVKWGDQLQAWAGHLRDARLVMLFVISFTMMGTFVTIYNYAGFRLMAAPYNLSAAKTGLIFSVYLFGILSASLAGGLADRLGRAPVLLAGILLTILGIFLTTLHPLPEIIVGITLVTMGFFCSHTVASSWVGLLAGKTKGHAASLYLLAYYLGASVMGSIGGHFWTGGGWMAVALFSLTMLAFALASAIRLRAVKA